MRWVVRSLSGLGLTLALVATVGCDGDDPATGGSGGGGVGGVGGGGAGGTGNVNAHCLDDEQSADETDVDCGGAECPGCGDGGFCQNHGDCAAQLYCSTAFACRPHCLDGRVTADESDVDCGGAECPGCAAGEDCGAPSDCAAQLNCVAGSCVPYCADGMQNAGETDLDCGGESCCPCALGEGCSLDRDCAAPLLCLAGDCAAACSDGLLNLNETDIDCGGDRCALCEAGDDCAVDGDCVAGLTCTGGLCSDRCADGVPNDAETDIDCGGPSCPRCAVGQLCAADADCFSARCDLGVSDRCGLRDDPLSVEELCLVLLDREQYGGELCSLGAYPSPLLSWDGGPLPEECRPGGDHHDAARALLASLAIGRVAIDWPTAHSCMAESRRLRALNPSYRLTDESQSPGSDWAALRDGDCTTFVTANQLIGEPCGADWECETGTACGSPGPYDPPRCLAPVAAGDPCSFYSPCEPGFACFGGSCAPGLAEGELCFAPQECASGYCHLYVELADARCEPQPLALGEPCGVGDRCAGCAICRPLAVASGSVCAVAAGPGDWCRGDDDCLVGLRCLEDACTAVGRGQSCTDRYFVARQCGEGYACMPEAELVNLCWAFDGDQAGCEAARHTCNATPSCAWDAANLWCDPREFRCQQLPESGACLSGYACAPGSYCDASGAGPECLPLPTSGPCADVDGEWACAEGFFCSATLSCEPRAAAGGACLDGPGACVDGYHCLAGSCVFRCQDRAECQPGEICDAATESCAPQRPQCAESSECAEGEFCTGPLGVCTRVQHDGAGCLADARCRLADLCRITPYDCRAHDGDQPSCDGAVGCAWYATSSTCWPDVDFDCAAYDNDVAACAAAAGCESQAVCVNLANYCWFNADNPTNCDAEPDCTWGGDQCVAIDCPSMDDDEAACTASGACYYEPFDLYCAPIPGVTPDCGPHQGNAAACLAETGCEVIYTCDPPADHCARLDGDEPACAGDPLCRWEGAACLAVGFGCHLAADASICAGLAPDCVWDASAAASGACLDRVRECLPKSDVGEYCSVSLDGDDCLSGVCSWDAQTLAYRCEPAIRSGCTADLTFLRSAFLFGMVFAVGGRRWRAKRRST